MEKISNDYRENVRVLDGLLGVGRSCDMVSRDYLIGGRRARLWVVDGFGSDSILERMGAFWLTLKPENVVGLTEMQDFLDRYITFSESNVTFDISDAVTSVFLGKSLLAVEGLAGVALMDAKGYPSRSVHEPPDGKVLRGSHDGFVEAVVPNMALLRRRIRDPHLTMEGHKVGSRTHNDAVLCYLDDKVDQDLLRKLRGKLLGLDVRSLTMAQESLAEAIRPAAVVCCASSDRRYSSACPDTLKLLADCGAKLYFSDCPPVPGMSVPPHQALAFTAGSAGALEARYVPVV